MNTNAKQAEGVYSWMKNKIILHIENQHIKYIHGSKNGYSVFSK
jgi:hypothetical protein